MAQAQVLSTTPIPNGGTPDFRQNGTPDPQNIGNMLRFSSGLILPPPEIKAVIDKTANFVANSQNPPQFEDKIRENQRSDPKFSFLNPIDPYHAYYRHRLDKITRGESLDDATPTPGTGAATPAGVNGAVGGDAGQDLMDVDIGVEPPTPEFVLDIPNISAIDLDIMKLTALFAARRGRTFLATLSAKEGRNYQFDFLRPTHSLFGYFNRLVEQYSKVLYPNKDMLSQLKEKSEDGARWKMLEQTKRHAKWRRNKREKDQKRKDDQEAERIAFAEIDWHDYAIVQTIEFTAADATSELPPPMSVQEVENMTLAQKRMAAMIMENTVEEVEAHKARQAEAEAAAAAAAQSMGKVTVVDEEEDAAMMEESDDEMSEERKRKEELERQREMARAHALQPSVGPMKIRTDYVSKVGAKNTKLTMTACSICGQQIPVDELQEHMRIELLDPKWKEQRDVLEARKAQASELQRGANVVSSLKNLARTRVDIFGSETDEERRKREEEEERERRREREKVVWDGHTASKANTLDKYSTNVNFDEQIAAIHRAKGLGPAEANAIGPGIGPAAIPPPLTSLPPPPASLPAPPVHHTKGPSSATISSGPTPASMLPSNAPAPVMLPPLHYQGLDAAQPFGYSPPTGGAGGVTSRQAALAAANAQAQQVQAGMVRTADQMLADGDGSGTPGGEDLIPPAKRQRVAKLPGGTLYPEEHWIEMHPYPISLQVQLPNDPSKPEWKLDGSVVTIPDLAMNLLISTLRERIRAVTGSALPASRMRISYQGKMLTNSSTLGSFNLEDEDMLVLSVSEARRR
ncbi:Splicing factor 3A subunit 1 [Leucoagaricus sp. SymC.cos]|nr:Splicing factor 3A subunit 1 [Leucoagaricus sp. SymC.cos]